MKTTSTVISSLVLVLSIAACGGSELSSDPQSTCTATQLSAWSACQSNSTRTRTVLAGDCQNYAALVETCDYCESMQLAGCVIPGGYYACCPTASPFYCQSMNGCYSTAEQCPTLAQLCK
jgi:hypothetical protein